MSVVNQTSANDVSGCEADSGISGVVAVDRLSARTIGARGCWSNMGDLGLSCAVGLRSVFGESGELVWVCGRSHSRVEGRRGAGFWGGRLSADETGTGKVTKAAEAGSARDATGDEGTQTALPVSQLLCEEKRPQCEAAAAAAQLVWLLEAQ